MQLEMYLEGVLVIIIEVLGCQVGFNSVGDGDSWNTFEWKSDAITILL